MNTKKARVKVFAAEVRIMVQGFSAQHSLLPRPMLSATFGGTGGGPLKWAPVACPYRGFKAKCLSVSPCTKVMCSQAGD